FFFVGRSDPLWANVLRGLLQGLRIAVILAAASLFLTVTDPVDLSDSILRAMEPLKRRGVRVGDLSLMLMIVFSFLPLIADEARRLRTAQAVRCGFHRWGLGMLKEVIPLLAPLVIGIFRRAEEMELSLAARCYNLERPRSSYTRSRVGRLDLVVFSASVLLFIFGLYAKLQANY
ncbi:MAG: energy-coupling factor transporter transmembrane protein EcfT, partial [Candidatus Krumholzibacteria bacterium]|nr:energy-coupling factor transporter transmembrane protein EcfT [Candidatus Krumholzibacteria bacterium]